MTKCIAPHFTQAKLREILNYDPDTGIFRWRISRKGRAVAGNVAGTYNSNGYLSIVVLGRRYMAHRLAFLWMIGRFPKVHTDHINRVRDDNRWANLREVTPLENAQNQSHPSSKRPKRAKIGASFDQKTGKWRARIFALGKSHLLGWYATEDEAVAAYWGARTILDEVKTSKAALSDPPRGKSAND